MVAVTHNPPRYLTHQERLRLGPGLADPEDRVYAELGLGPCQRPGGEADWWDAMHAPVCEGYDYLRPGMLVLCACPCHLGARP